MPGRVRTETSETEKTRPSVCGFHLRAIDSRRRGHDPSASRLVGQSLWAGARTWRPVDRGRSDDRVRPDGWNFPGTGQPTRQWTNCRSGDVTPLRVPG